MQARSQTEASLLCPTITPSVEFEVRGPSFEAVVALRAVPSADPLAGVGGGDKAVRIKAEDMGDIFVSAHGAEPLATAAAALKDLKRMLETSAR